jgi:hypothetical protein
MMRSSATAVGLKATPAIVSAAEATRASGKFPNMAYSFDFVCYGFGWYRLDCNRFYRNCIPVTGES